MSCSNCYYYWNDEKYCPKRQMHMLAGDSCKYWQPNDAMSISQRMNEGVRKMTECKEYGLKCLKCPYWNPYSNYCTKYKIWSETH